MNLTRLDLCSTVSSSGPLLLPSCLLCIYCRKYECSKEALLKFKEEMDQKEHGANAIAAVTQQQQQQFMQSFGAFVSVQSEVSP